MTARFMAWWRERSLREQRLLLIMFALLGLTILWLGIYRPVESALSAARERHQQAVIALGEVHAQSDALRAFGGSPAASGPLAPIVTQAATEAGFANAVVAAQGERRVSISIPAARPAPVLGWIAGLEARGIVVERLTARANSDPTLTVDATLAAGS
ncbi:type II secretion system protein M [Sphingomonas sp. ID1715]|uniref:type II secretion system protein GspM n=1 Tax=Sphingomonas sp. ID1715 TaxID=1656898 RepID=UPI001488E9A1|nr:type II secretion system protein GspM [Sphingomonas sp. ID1715]NNM77899.1 type II secretion system protein M [Sphingomonas sp. ID1715]